MEVRSALPERGSVGSRDEVVVKLVEKRQPKFRRTNHHPQAVGLEGAYHDVCCSKRIDFAYP
jgi:hypothetical protein